MKELANAGQSVEREISREAWGPRQYKGAMGRLVTVIAVAMSVYHLLYLSHVLTALGIDILAVPHRVLTVGFIVTLVLLLYPATKGAARDRLPWYDLAMVLLALGGFLYLFVIYEKEIYRLDMVRYHTYELVLCFVTIGVVLEATRRVVGWVMPAMVVLFIGYAYYSDHFPGILLAKGYSISRIAAELFFGDAGLFGIATGVVATLVILFIIFGRFMLASGGGQFITDVALALMGHMSGGPAKVAVVASALFGTISGSSAANVTTTGTFTIPLMKSVGYKPEFAAAVEAVASNGGIYTPPVMGAAIFIMAEWIGATYLEVCVAAIVPAILYFVALFVMVDREAVRGNLMGIPRSQLPSLRQTLKRGWFLMAPIFVLLYFVMIGYTVTTAVVYALGASIVVSMFRKDTRLGPTKLLKGLASGATGTAAAGIPCAAAGLIIGSLSLTGVGLKLSGEILVVSGGNTLVLLALAGAACFVLGMGMAIIPAYVMVASLVVPALLKAGVMPLAAHLFVLYYALTSHITPPVAITAYVAAGVANSQPLRTAVTAMRLGICTYVVPIVFVYNSALLLRGPVGELVIGVLSAGLAVGFLSIGLSGYGLRHLSWWERILQVMVSVSLLMPISLSLKLVGLGVGVVTVLWQAATMRDAKRDAADTLAPEGTEVSPGD